jgi:hypothetical protein
VDNGSWSITARSYLARLAPIIAVRSGQLAKIDEVSNPMHLSLCGSSGSDFKYFVNCGTRFPVYPETGGWKRGGSLKVSSRVTETGSRVPDRR